MISKQLSYGVLGGLAGGLVFGGMMGMMGMLPMIGKMAGIPTALGGFLIHMVISALIGVGFVALFGRKVTRTSGGLGYGMAYGVIWWFLGPLTLMPLMMGMGFGVNWSFAAMGNMLPSLIGHGVYGLILGALYGWCQNREAARLIEPAAQETA